MSYSKMKIITNHTKNSTQILALASFIPMKLYISQFTFSFPFTAVCKKWHGQLSVIKLKRKYILDRMVLYWHCTGQSVVLDVLLSILQTRRDWRKINCRVDSSILNLSDQLSPLKDIWWWSKECRITNKFNREYLRCSADIYFHYYEWKY